MTEYIANMLTKNMYMDGLIKESEESIYSYSIQLIVEKIIGFSAIYMIALFQGYFFETVLFTISLSNLRKCTGGYHANSFRSCFIGTVSIYLIYIKLIYPYLLNNMKINMIIFRKYVIIGTLYFNKCRPLGGTFYFFSLVRNPSGNSSDHGRSRFRSSGFGKGIILRSSSNT